ncbi:hypothetical protein B0H13DRAFT_642324 [Mycena leptocephala]|nr:hypothetical protein B0H13DRAFT_642324 [Mycena leptocephala]
MARIGVWASFRRGRSRRGGRGGKGMGRERGRERAMYATLSASSSRPWAFVGSGASGSLASEVSEFSSLRVRGSWSTRAKERSSARRARPLRLHRHLLSLSRGIGRGGGAPAFRAVPVRISGQVSACGLGTRSHARCRSTMYVPYRSIHPTWTFIRALLILSLFFQFYFSRSLVGFRTRIIGLS